MLTISRIKNSIGAANYFATEDNYYMSEVEARKTSSWWGKGAVRQGLEGKIDQKTLQRLFEGHLPNGTTIGLQKDGTIRHRPGIDLCFSAPKSVSILALDGGDKRLYQAHVDAVSETMQLIERDAAQAKVYKNGRAIFQNTKNLIVGLVNHTTSRKVDMQLHTHALVMNATERRDGSWRALASSRTQNSEVNGFAERIYHHQIYYGVVYKTALAHRVKELGYTIEKAGAHGMWEIKDVPIAARRAMSKRRLDIEKNLEKMSYKSARATDFITLSSRDKKQKNINESALKEIWREELSSVGFSSERCIQTVSEVKKARELKEVGNQGSSKSRGTEADSQAISEEVRIAVTDAIKYLSRYKLKLSYERLVTKALEFSLHGNIKKHADIVSALNGVIREGDLISLDKSESTFITKELIKDEQDIMGLVQDGQGVAKPIDFKNIATMNLDTEKQQVVSAMDVLKSSDNLSLVEHQGVDNTLFLDTILRIAESSGKTVRILSPNRLIAEDTNQDFKRQPNSLWQWLLSLGKPEIGDSIAGFNFRYRREVDAPLLRFRKGKDVIVVNNAEMVGNKDVLKLLSLAKKSQARVIFLADTTTRKSITAGNPIETIKQANVEKYVLASPVNEQEDIITELKGIEDNDERARALAEAFAARESLEQGQTKAIVGSKGQLKLANSAIREALKDIGLLSRLEHDVDVLNPTLSNDIEKSYANKYQKGMVIRFYHRGTVEDAKILKTNKKDNTLLIDIAGRKKIWNPRTGISKGENFVVFKPESIKLAEGDKLMATARMFQFGIKSKEQFEVQHINNRYVALLKTGDAKTTGRYRTVKIAMRDLNKAHFDYDYAKTITQSSRKPVDHLLVDMKAYALDKPTITTLRRMAEESMAIYTENVTKAETSFDRDTPKITGTGTLLKTAGIDRIISERTTSELRQDIEKAIFALTNKPDETVAERAVNFALEKITSRNAGFTHKHLVTESLVYALHEHMCNNEGTNVTREDITNVINEKRKSGELIMGRHFSDGTRWTTKEILNLERSIISSIRKERGKIDPLVESKAARDFLEKTHLTKDQKNACYLITTTKDRFTVVQGDAGTGKTTMFMEVQNMLEGMNKENEKDVELIAFAPTHKAVRELNDRGIKAATLKSFLLEEQHKKSNLENKLIILDESSMVSNRDFADFVDIVIKGNGRAVFSGDIAQHIAIESGKPYEVIQKTKSTAIAYLKENLRQQTKARKDVVRDVLDGDYESAFNRIERDNPKTHIERSHDSDFFNTLSNSIVAVDNNKLKPGNKTLEEYVAEDYLSRTPEVQRETVVIVHAHEDRKCINSLIRAGLKEQGRVGQEDMKISRLISKGHTKAELKLLSSYEAGDVVKLGKTHYRVAAGSQHNTGDNRTKSILLEREDGTVKYFYPKKSADKNNVELYKSSEEALSTGDIIKLTKTDKERDHYANFEYRVNSFDGDKILLESIDGKGNIQLDRNELKDQHWDYAYTVTGYGIQGGSKSYAIDFEVSYRKHLASQRSFYIGATRAKLHFMVYTDNKDRLLRRILSNKGDKNAALEVVGNIKAGHHFNKNNKSVSRANNADKIRIYHKDFADIEKSTTKQHHESGTTKSNYDAKEILHSLNASAEAVVKGILGEPNKSLSSANEYRYGRKGSLAINMQGDKRGLWYNFETQESGNLIKLIQLEKGISFSDALKYAADNGHTLHSIGTNILKQNSRSRIKPATGTKKYAEKLALESQPIKGSLVERYLKEHRGIGSIESTNIRYHPKVHTGKGQNPENLPAMLAISRDNTGKIQCVQATYLDPETGNKADIDVNKRTYASPKGNPVKLQESIDQEKITFIAEGAETGMSLKDIVPNAEIMVTLGKNNMAHINVEEVGNKVILCLDNDGIDIRDDKVVSDIAGRLMAAGKEVYIAMPKSIDGCDKVDFNDILVLQGKQALKDSLDNIVAYEEWAKTSDQASSKDGKELLNMAEESRYKDTESKDTENSLPEGDLAISTAEDQNIGQNQLSETDFNRAKFQVDHELADTEREIY